MKVLEAKIRATEFRVEVLSTRVSKILTEAILEGVLEGGQKLIETEIQDMFGISRSPLREAIRDLEKKGLVTIVPRKGAFVKQVSVKDIEDIFPVRANLEALAARLAHSKIVQADLDDMHAVLEQMTAAVRKDDVQTYWRNHSAFHELFIHASGNDVLIQMLNRLRLHSLWYRFSYRYYEENLRKQISIHQQIYRLFEDRKADVRQLERLVHGHIAGAFEKFIGFLGKRESQTRESNSIR
jgi:DNA-binding GntR family transcriptional regulator